MIDQLPYEVHTNRELEMMLAGKKPLAWFYEEKTLLPNEDFIPEDAFGVYVKQKRFVRSEMYLPGGYSQQLNINVCIKHVAFALADEAWRISALFLLLEQQHKTKDYNSETLERMLGRLLGYTEEENDAYCLLVAKNNSG